MTLKLPDIKYLLAILMILIMLLWVTSCSPEYHVKRAAHHYEKAMKKGFKPLKDTIKSQSELALKYNTDYLSHLKPRILIKLDSFDITPEEKEKVAKIVYREVEAASKELELDTVITIDYEGKEIGMIKAKIKDGKLTIGHQIAYPKPIVYKESFFESIGFKAWWQKISFWIIIIALVVLIIYKKLIP